MLPIIWPGNLLSLETGYYTYLNVQGAVSTVLFVNAADTNNDNLV